MQELKELIHLWRLLLRKKWKIAAVCALVGVVSAVYIKAIPAMFESEVLMIPEVQGNAVGGNLSSMASLIGGKMQASGDDAIYPEFYPRVLGTPQFLCSMMNATVKPSKGGKPVRLYDYLAYGQKSPWWSPVIHKFFSLFRRKKKAGGDAYAPTSLNPAHLSREQMGVVGALGNLINSTVDKRTDMVTIKVRMQDPAVAAQVATIVQNRLQDYIVDYRTGKARNDAEYMRQITATTKAEYEKAQRRYAAYVDANQNAVLAAVSQHEERLENEMQLAFNSYSDATRQLQAALAKVQERTPAFTVLQPAGVPIDPSSPHRLLFVAIMMFMAFVGSVAYFVLRDSIEKRLSQAAGGDSCAAAPAVSAVGESAKPASAPAATDDAKAAAAVEAAAPAAPQADARSASAKG